MTASIHETASEWFVDFRTGEPVESERKRFLAWLRESPLHMVAYLEVAALWAESGKCRVERRWPEAELIAQAKEQPDNVVEWVAASDWAAPRLRPVAERISRRMVFGWVAAAASIVVAVIAVLNWPAQKPEIYSTGVGEQRAVTLADGSTLRLNARSKLEVSFSRQQRQVELLEGQVLFRVVKDSKRPFVAIADGTPVRVLGTEFDLRRRRSTLVVTVLEGRVAAGPVLVAAGQQATHASGEWSAVKIVDPKISTAWTRRELFFDSTPLSEVVDEFNLYNTRQLVIRDPALESFRIDGVFSSPDPASLVRFLESRLEVRAVANDSEISLELEEP
jgi:transmembrane sensor